MFHKSIDHGKFGGGGLLNRTLVAFSLTRFTNTTGLGSNLSVARSYTLGMEYSVKVIASTW